MASYTGGSKASSRIQALEAERKQRQQDLEQQRKVIAAASSEVLNRVTGGNFAVRKGAVEELLKSDTVGLVTHEDFKARRKYLERCAVEELEKREAAKREQDAATRRQRLKKADRAKLSFADDSDDSDDSEDVEKDQSEGEKELEAKECAKRKGSTSKDSQSEKDDDNPLKRRRLGINPDIDASFIPDRERELAEQRERERLKQEWINAQEAIKNEVVRVTYSYWDGAGHRKMIKCKKGTTIGRFLAIVQTHFRDLRNTSADSLMFIKEDLIIPHHYSFYDFIVSKARGVSMRIASIISWRCTLFRIFTDQNLLHAVSFAFPILPTPCPTNSEKWAPFQF